eukprot:CAMPEP_0206202996 /NCGR_PEP_ID=MMETSP0166-20121206/12536_1 /ASSEMBLY_ACC=CAM_ASM_000260 /TAXON_ID=95228 /ORGANISM="Vannella robusta, Strain DIVA3 518/3/11/1/6" /LENGTH=388 /DNA_ID=CAMNT_0053622089 /DNA_START=750 /DNA_END=1916 /DNA_ORIENTATION=-
MECPAIQDEYNSTLVDSLFPEHRGKVFTYSQTPLTSPSRSYFSQKELDVLTPIRKRKTKRRNIPKVPEKILDAPDFVDDYYLNLLDWSSDNLLAVALGRTVYIWNADSGDISVLVTLGEDDYVCSVSWANAGQYISVGTFKGDVLLYDGHQGKLVRTLKGHGNRVSSLAWNGQIVSSGSRDSTIINFDVGEQMPVVSVFEGHEQEVCGLKWNPEGTQLASGGNDNLLLVWDHNNSERPRFQFNDHQAAVKAIEWCPHQPNLLVSGGGTADRHIRFWNTSTGACLGAHDTKSQVCSILWSKSHKDEIISSHGFSQNQLIVWEYPTMTKLTELSGHTQRVLQMAMSPEGETVVSVAADETLRFWKVFEKQNNHSNTKVKNSRLLGNCFIR